MKDELYYASMAKVGVQLDAMHRIGYVALQTTLLEGDAYWCITTVGGDWLADHQLSELA